jgi:hypothetical protein
MATALARAKSRPKDLPVPFRTYARRVSPRQAREELDAAAYPFQRPLRPYQVAYLRTLIEQHQLRAGTTITFAVFRQTKQRYCLNGRHTLTALAETTGDAYPLQFEEYLVDSEEEVSRLYQSFDRNLARSWKDLYRADVRLYREDLPPSVLNKLGGVTQLLASGFKHNFILTGGAWQPILRNATVRFTLMYDWLPLMREFQSGLSGATAGVRKLLYRSSVLAIALITYRFQSARAHAFWPRLARDSGLSEGEPEWALLRYLREHGTRAIEPAVYQRKVAAAWNLYYNRRPVRDLQARAAKDPILILGTPHDGTAHYGYLAPDGTVYTQPQVIGEVPETGAISKSVAALTE